MARMKRFECVGNTRNGETCGRPVLGSKKCWQHRSRRKKRLTKKESRFVDELAKPSTPSATKAAEAAGYSNKSARFIAAQNLTKPHIKEALKNRQDQIRGLIDVKEADIVAHAILQMYSSIDDVLDENGNVCLRKARATGGIHQIQELTITTRPDGTRQEKIKMKDSSSARTELSRFLGMHCPVPHVMESVAFYEDHAKKLIKDYPHISLDMGDYIAMFTERVTDMPYPVKRVLMRKWGIDEEEIASVQSRLNTSYKENGLIPEIP